MHMLWIAQTLSAMQGLGSGRQLVADTGIALAKAGLPGPCDAAPELPGMTHWLWSVKTSDCDAPELDIVESSTGHT